MKLKQGDIVSFTQEDGNTLVLTVYPDGIAIKADFPGTSLTIDRDSSFLVMTKAIKRKTKKEIIDNIRKKSLDLSHNGYMLVLEHFSLTSFSVNRLEEVPSTRLVDIIDMIRWTDKL